MHPCRMCRFRVRHILPLACLANHPKTRWAKRMEWKHIRPMKPTGLTLLDHSNEATDWRKWVWKWLPKPAIDMLLSHSAQRISCIRSITHTTTPPRRSSSWKRHVCPITLRIWYSPGVSSARWKHYFTWTAMVVHIATLAAKSDIRVIVVTIFTPILFNFHTGTYMKLWNELSSLFSWAHISK